MTSQGHPYARFQRAIKSGNLLVAETAARELTQVSVEDALSLVLLYREDPRRYERAAAKWLARFLREDERSTLADAEVLAGLLRGVAAERDRDARAALGAFAAARGWRIAG